MPDIGIPDSVFSEVEKMFYPAIVFTAEGARAMIATCKRCGAAVMEGDGHNGPLQHFYWHQSIRHIITS